MNQLGVIQGIEHKIGVWSDRLTETESDLAAQEAIIAAPFAKQAELDAKTSRFNEVMSILNPKDEQVIGDEGDVQYQARKPLDDEDIRDDIYFPRKKADAAAFIRSYANKTSSLKNGETKNIVIFTANDAYLVTATGYLQGDITKVLNLSSSENVNKITKEFAHGTDERRERSDEGTEAFNSWTQDFQNDIGGNDSNRTGTRNKRAADRTDAMDDGASRSDIVGYNRENYGYNSLDELNEAIDSGAMVMDDNGDIIQHQQRTSPLTDREVLSIAASEVNVEGLTDGGRDARAGAAAALFCSPPPCLSPDYTHNKCHGQYFYLISIISVPTTMSARPNAAFLLKCSLNTNAEKPMETRILSLSMGTTTLARPSCNAL